MRRQSHHIVTLATLLALGAIFTSPPAGAESPAADPRCGTWRVLEGDATFGPAMAAVRPAPGALQTASSHFVVHFAHAGLTAYAQDVSDAAEYAYRALVDTLGHLAPLPDGTAGGDARLDIYLRTPDEIGGVYGVTYPETRVAAPYVNSYNCWVEVVDTMAVPRRVSVAAHEVYHAIQIVYDRAESGSLLEMLSTWVEERLYDEYNLHYDSLRLFFRQPQRGLFSQVYSNVPWAIYLTEHYGDAIMRETLVHCTDSAGPNPRDAFDSALIAVAGTNFLDEFIRFGTYNYFVGARDDGEHYSEGASYYTTTVDRRSLCYPEPTSITRAAGELGALYVMLDGDGYSDPLEFHVIPEYVAATMMTMTRFKGATRTTSTTFFPFMSTPEDSVLISDWAACDSVLVVFQVDTGGSLNTFAFRSRHRPAPPAAGDWLLVLDRDGCRAPFDGAADDFSDRDGQDGPVASSLRALGATVVASDSLPASLVQCRGIFLVGGFDGAGVNLDSAELDVLNAFMDAGGDVYVEGSRLGEFMDPSLGAGDPTEQAFWGRFGASFVPGLASGNVGAWETTGNSAIGAHTFAYDPGEPDAFVGRLVPGAAAFLARDGGGEVRATVRTVAGSSTRIMSTVLLGGSTGTGGSTREGFLNDVLVLFATNLATLSVARANLAVDGRDVLIDGLLEHYDGQALRCERVEEGARADVALELRRAGGEWRFSARDRMTADAAIYRLIDEDAGRVLWEERAQARVPALALRVLSVYPNPARDDVRVLVESAADARAILGVYDVAGRRVLEEAVVLRRGGNTLYLRRLPVGSGVYFIRVASGGRDAGARVLVLR